MLLPRAQRWLPLDWYSSGACRARQRVPCISGTTHTRRQQPVRQGARAKAGAIQGLGDRRGGDDDGGGGGSGWGLALSALDIVAREAWEGRRPKPPSSDLRSPSLAQEQCGRRTPEPFDCPWGCGESIEGGNTGLERHRDACSREPRRLMATIRQLQVQNQQLTSENRELETSSVPTWVRPSPAGPGACIE